MHDRGRGYDLVRVLPEPGTGDALCTAPRAGAA